MDARRSAGLGLVGYGVLTIVAMFGLNTPGGDYEPDKVTAYLSADHLAAAVGFGYVGILGALSLLVFGRGARSFVARSADLVWALVVAAVTAGVLGSMAAAGIAVAGSEGGDAIRTGVPLPVVQLFGEVAGLVMLCVPALFVGIVAIVLARRASLPVWLRVAGVVAGACGILAPAFLTFFVFLLWTLVFGGWLAMTRRPVAAEAQPIASLV
jgi:hypothetical protein